jgi:acetyl esterase/lipase
MRPQEVSAISHDEPLPTVPTSTSPVETLTATAPDGAPVPVVLRRPARETGAPLVVLLHGGLDPLPVVVLSAIAERGASANHLLAAGHPIAVPTRRARPDGHRPAGAVLDTLAAVAAAREAVGGRGIALFGSSGGGDLALEVTGELDPTAVLVEEPATSLLCGVLDADTPRRGETWAPDEVWPTDYARHYTEERRAATRAVLERIACPLAIAEGDQPVEGTDPRRGLHAVLLPELEALGKPVTHFVYPGQTHGFGMLTGVAPDPVPDATAAAVRRFCADLGAFLGA